MADVSNSKINVSSDVERSNLVNKIGNENWKKRKIANSAEYQIDEKFQNLLFLEPNFEFPNSQNST